VKKTFSRGVVLFLALITAVHAADQQDRMEAVVSAERGRLTASVTEKALNLSVLKRRRDPFGIPINGEIALAEAPPPAAVATEQEKPQKPTLSDAVRDLRIDGLNPGRKEFFTSTRVVHVGDVLQLTHRGEQFEARVAEVTSFAVVYEDPRDGTRATVQLSIIPH
jgi:hypothetical protein